MANERSFGGSGRVDLRADRISLARNVAASGDAYAGGSPGAPPGSKEEAIVGAAIELLGERGFHGAGLRQIATRAGVSLANVYTYFPSKADLLLAILKRACADLLVQVQDSVRGAGSGADERFVAAASAYVRFCATRSTEMFIADSEVRYLDPERREELLVHRDAIQDVFERIVADGVRGGRFATPYPDQACLAVLTMCSGVAQWYRPDGPLTADALAERFAHYALALVEEGPAR
ncbi:MAG: TetR family transcriptional regulator [Streptosporangiales bacterium]|nr:TetR family transcriptional regulator [Streptosporangiales bacterium]